MINTIKSLLLISLVFSLTISCHLKSNYHVELLEINEEGLAIYKVLNNTTEDILYMEFELVYSNADNKVIKMGTVGYRSGFVIEAKGETMIAQKVTDNTTTATARIISFSN